MPQPGTPERLSTGVAGLDQILAGGLPVGGLYLLEGSPGSGKTTLALQFLRAGATRGERTLLVVFSETRDELAAFVASHGWSLDGIDDDWICPTCAGSSAMRPSRPCSTPRKSNSASSWIGSGTASTSCVRFGW